MTKQKYDVYATMLQADLKEGIDYEILSVQVVDKNIRTIPFERYYSNEDVFEIASQEGRTKSVAEIIEEKYGEDESVLTFTTTRPIKKLGQLAYLLAPEDVDIDTAIDCGMGVIRMLKGEYEGFFFLYNSENEEEHIGFMLDIYLQIAVEEYDNKDLEKFYSTKDGKTTLLALKNTDDNALPNKLEDAFRKNKGGDNVVNFIQ